VRVQIHPFLDLEEERLAIVGMARRGERVASIRRLEEEEERVARLERVAKEL
jgi:hypothetical protein